MSGASGEAPPALRLGFLGVGWIGRHRMGAMMATGLVREALVCDPADENVRAALSDHPQVRRVECASGLLGAGLDGLVIATPSALHAGQAIAAFDRSAAVFCQKPVGRSLEEVRGVVAAGERSGRLLGCDFSYRRTRAAERLKALLAEGRLGHVFAADLTFHNAYGPDKPWFYDRALSGGGCLMDLGVHLVDLLGWLLGEAAPERVQARLFAGGAAFTGGGGVEDYAVAALDFPGLTARLACSWKLSAGRDAEISVRLYGDRAGAELVNVGGSFYDFEAALLEGNRRTVLVEPPDDWGGRVAADWVRALAQGAGYDPAEGRSILAAAARLDAIYAAAGAGAPAAS